MNKVRGDSPHGGQSPWGTGRAYRNGRRGFTLLEVLLASFLVGVCIIALMEAFNRSITGTGHVEDYTRAVMLAQEGMEEVKGKSFGSVTSEARALVSGFTEFEREVQVTETSSDLKKVEAIVYWAVPNGENSVRLVTYAVDA